MSIKKDGCDHRQDRTAATTTKHSRAQCLKHFRVYHKDQADIKLYLKGETIMKMHHSFIRQPAYAEISIEEINKLISEAEKLSGKSCPFCGGEASVRLGFLCHMAPAVQITCEKCGCQTSRHVAGMMANGKEYTVQDRLYQALSVWNKRAYDET